MRSYAPKPRPSCDDHRAGAVQGPLETWKDVAGGLRRGALKHRTKWTLEGVQH